MEGKGSEGGHNDGSASRRSTIGLKTSTKKRMDKLRAPGQCYDGFIQQLVDFWEERNGRPQTQPCIKKKKGVRDF